MDFRVEVWSLPDDPGGFRLLCEPPYTTGTSFQDRFDVYGGGRLVVPADYEHLGLIIDTDPSDVSSSRSSLIRILGQVDGDWEYVYEFFADDSEEEINAEGQRVISISGNEMQSAMDDGIVYPRKEKDPNWQWGAPTLTENPDLSEGTVSDEDIQIWTTAAGGTWTIQVNGGSFSSAIAWNADASAVKAAIEGLASVTDVRVGGAGTVDDPWHIIFVDPGKQNLSIVTNETSLTGGTGPPRLFLRTVSEGGVFRPTYHTHAQTIQGVTFGTVGGGSLVVVDDPAGGSGKALLVTGTSTFIGAQQILDGVAGIEGYATVEFYRPAALSSDTKFRLVIRDIDEGFIASTGGGLAGAGYEGQTIPADTWTTLTIPNVVIPDNIDQIILRAAVVSEGHSGTFYIRNLSFHPGLPPTTWGDILGTLTSVAQARGTLTYLELDFDASVDSNGDPWDANLAFQADALMRLGGHVVGDGQAMGYEHDMVPGGTGTHKLQAFNPGGRGETAGTHPAMALGSIEGARLAKRRVPYTHLLMETIEGLHVEATDARLAGFPRRERGVRVEQAADFPTASKIAQSIFNEDIDNLLATQVRLESDTVVPYRDFDIAWQVPYVLGDRAATHNRRIHGITVAFTDDRWVAEVTASRLFPAGRGGVNSPMALEAIRKLFALFDRKQRIPVRRNAVLPQFLPASPISQPALLRVAGNIFPASDSGQDIPWELVNDPDGIIAGIGGGTEIQFSTAGLYHIAWTIYAEWSSTTSGWAQWQLLPALWKGGGQLVEGSWGPWEVWSHDDASGTIVMKATVSHLVEVRDISHVYITGYSLINEDPPGFLDTGTGTIFGGP